MWVLGLLLLANLIVWCGFILVLALLAKKVGIAIQLLSKIVNEFDKYSIQIRKAVSEALVEDGDRVVIAPISRQTESIGGRRWFQRRKPAISD